MRRQKHWQTLCLVILLLLCATLCLADSDDGDTGFDSNPVLDKQPTFARSLVVQILLDGIVVALTAVLLIHLLFTGQYHWPLAPVNYALQLSGVICLFISITATIVVVMSQAFRDSQQWPYMFTYISIVVPPVPKNTTSTNGTTLYDPIVWSTSELAAWYVMDATTSAVVQITHIQFLTLLYPSHLEARLILGLLAPLALVAAAMQLLPIHQSQAVLDIADTIRNTCNAALSVLFTTAVVLWGFLVNRKGAWRTDGGTAAFGAGAITLAIGSTALNFVYIPARDQYPWLRHFIWVVILWQSFLGWWWWVGSGCGVSEVEELMRREERRDRKRKARAAKRSARKERAQALWRSASQSLGFTRRNSHGEPIEMANLAGQAGAVSGNGVLAVSASDNTTTSTSVTAESGFFGRLRSSPPLQALSHFYHLLRRAHLTAVHSQTLDYVRRRRAVFNGETNEGGITLGVDSVDPGVVGWGLGSFGLRERERRAMEQAGDNDREDLVDHGMTADADGTEADWDTHQRDGGIPAVAPTRTHSTRLPREEATSIWWWGPLRRWRMQDSTSY